jgi:hypothetical protein
MNTALNRTVIVLLTNKSGGSVAQGDVVVIDLTAASSFTTTTTPAYVDGSIGVVLEPNGIANNAIGTIALGGFIPKINLSSSASLGNLFKTHTVAKQAAIHAAPLVTGDFGFVLETGATPKAFLFGSTNQGGSGVVDAEYVTTAAHASLSAEVNIPGLAGSSDRAGIGGAGVAYEFDSGASPLTWSSAIDAEDVDTTVKSHLYIQDNGAAESLGTYSWAPAGAFDIRCKVSLGAEVAGGANASGIGLLVGDSAMNNRCLNNFTYNGGTDRFEINVYTYAGGSYTQRGVVQYGMGSVVYLRIVRDGSNNNSFYWSSDGLLWLLIATQALTYTAAKAGLRISGNSVVTNAAIDYIRSDV